MKFLDKYKLLSNHQHFRNKKSCTTNLLETLDFATKVISQKDQLDLLFPHSKKASDNVPHNWLLLKLSKYGISGKVKTRLKCF